MLGIRKKYPSLNEVIEVLPQHGHIKDQVVWNNMVYDLEAWTSLSDMAILVNCHITLKYNDVETLEWIKRGKK